MIDVSALRRLEAYHSDDVGHSQRFIASVLSSHRIIAGDPQAARVTLQHFALPAVAAVLLTYGTPVSVHVTLKTWYAIVFVLRGHNKVHILGQTRNVGPGEAFILSTPEAATMEMSADLEQFVLRIDRLALERVLRAILDGPLIAPLLFDPVVDLADGSRRYLCEVIQLVVNAAADGRRALDTVPFANALQSLLLNALLVVQPHSYSSRMLARQFQVAPHCVKLAEAYIDAHADEAISIARLSEVAGTSARSLHHAFAQFRGVSPMRYLRDIRLERARQDLQNPGPGDTVTGIALRCGFSQLGRFAGAYRTRFGESPSDTLRQAERLGGTNRIVPRDRNSATA
jgi:AraC-like DNA-binding protein